MRVQITYLLFLCGPCMRHLCIMIHKIMRCNNMIIILEACCLCRD